MVVRDRGSGRGLEGFWGSGRMVEVEGWMNNASPTIKELPTFDPE